MTNNKPWKALHKYWLQKHQNGLPPSRKDIDPLTEITSLVGNLALLEPVDGSFRYRLVGTEIVARVGMDMTGLMVGLTSTLPNMRDQWRTALESVARHQKPELYLSTMLEGTTARNIVLILPLVTPTRTTEMLLAGIFFDGYIEPGRAIEGLSRLDLE
jgi:hypothetical protein